MGKLRRVERSESRVAELLAVARTLAQPGALWSIVRDYIGLGRSRRLQPITDRGGLKLFLRTRSTHVAQTSLYGYVRTRAGMRYPELFDDDAFVASLNIAKWQMWLACLSDLAVYSAGLLARADPSSGRGSGMLVHGLVAEILEETGVPADAGPAYAEAASAVLQRVAGCDPASVPEDGGGFTESPAALVRWAPVVDVLKELDEPIVVNSVRFRWQEVRRDLRRILDAGSVLRGDARGPGDTQGEAVQPSPAG